MRDLGRHAAQRVRVHLTGGATAVLVGWRSSTVDVDIHVEPEDEDLLRRVPVAMEAVPVNVEFAAPPDFVRELPGWRKRSAYAFTEGVVEVHHFDLYSQALAKLERALERDVADVRAMRGRAMIEPNRLLELFAAVEPELYRYPAIDPAAFRARVESFAREG